MWGSGQHSVYLAAPPVGASLTDWGMVFPVHSQTKGRVTDSVYAIDPSICSSMLLCLALGDLMVVNSVPARLQQHAFAHIFAIVLHTMNFYPLFSTSEVTVRAPLLGHIVPLHEVF